MEAQTVPLLEDLIFKVDPWGDFDWPPFCEVSISFSLVFLSCSYSSKSDIFSVIRDNFWLSILHPVVAWDFLLVPEHACKLQELEGEGRSFVTSRIICIPGQRQLTAGGKRRLFSHLNSPSDRGFRSFQTKHGGSICLPGGGPGRIDRRHWCKREYCVLYLLVASVRKYLDRWATIPGFTRSKQSYNFCSFYFRISY